MFCKLVFDQKTASLLQLHVDAFEFFGGTVRVVVPDNLKAAVIQNSFGVGKGTELNRSYQELAEALRVQNRPDSTYSPQAKGKIESAVKYVKRNALSGRSGEDVRSVNEMLLRWVVDIAGKRMHGTTHKKPLSVFEEEERKVLLPHAVSSLRLRLLGPQSLHPRSRP